MIFPSAYPISPPSPPAFLSSYSLCSLSSCKQLKKLKLSQHTYVSYCTWENFGREKLVNSVNHELFTKIFLPNIHWKCSYLACALIVAYSPNFSLPIAFTFIVRQIFPLPKFSSVRHTLAMWWCSVFNVAMMVWLCIWLRLSCLLYSLRSSKFYSLNSYNW